MSNTFKDVGSRDTKETRFAPIFTNRFFSGLWLQRSALRDPSEIGRERYYGGRPDALIRGNNLELTNRLTLARRPGTYAYSTATFSGAVTSFYAFKQFSTNSETITLMADTSSNVYTLGTTAKTSILSKGTGAGNSSFLGVGNTLYIGDGVEQKAWGGGVATTRNWGISIATAQVSTSAYAGTGADSGGGISSWTNPTRIQGAPDASYATTNYTIPAHQSDTISNALSATNYSFTTNFSTVNGITVTATGFQTGALAAFCILVATLVYNGAVIGTFRQAVLPTSAGTVTFGGTSDTWGATLTSDIVNSSSFGVRLFQNYSNGTGSSSNDAVSLDSAQITVTGVGAAPAPIATNTPVTAPFSAWAATTFYNPTIRLLDSNGFIQKLTTAGTTGGSAPSWDITPGNTTTDNTAVWTNQGTGTWVSTTAYALNYVVASSVTVTYQYLVGYDDDGNPLFANYNQTYYEFFQATTAGTSGSTLPTWNVGFGSTTADGTVIWADRGSQVVWDSATTGQVNVSANTVVVTDTTIIDSNGALENVVSAGVSGATHPTWATSSGVYTSEVSGLAWTNAGVFSSNSANTGAYQYVYEYANSTGSPSAVLSTASPKSPTVTLAANSVITLQGPGSGDSQVDKIYIFRTRQGGSVFQYLDQINNPGLGMTWTYSDSFPDSTLNPDILADLIGLNTQPPIGLISLAYHMSKVWGSVGNTVYYASGSDLGNIAGNPNEGFPPANYFVYPSLVKKLVPTSVGLLVFTVSDVYIIYGNSSAIGAATGVAGLTVFYSAPFLADVGLLSPFALDVNGTTIYLMTSDNQAISLDPSAGVSEIGFPIGAASSAYPTDYSLSSFSPASTYLTWHVNGSQDKAIYVSDGSTGWFRCNTSQAPDGGFVWSPKAGITGGCQAVQSIEVSPGIHQLLIGPGSGGGSVLVRNPATTATITNTVLTSNVATITCANSFVVGQYINIVDTTNSSGAFNISNKIITTASSTQFTFALTHSNIGSAADTGTVVLSNSDNGTAYSCNATMGSITLAEPGQLAEVAFITCDFTKLGSKPVISVLLNEITGIDSGRVSPPIITAATVGSGSLSANTYYLVITAIDSSGTQTGPSNEVRVVAGASSSIALTFNYDPRSVSYRIYYATSSGAQANYFASATAGTYTLTTLAGSSSASPPSAYTTAQNSFENLSLYTHSDPPALYGISGAPTTVISNRYDLLQSISLNSGLSPDPAICRHLQIYLDFGPIDVTANELLTLTLFGTHYQEM